MTADEKLRIETRVVEMLRTVFDPEIPVDIYSLGLIYNIDVTDGGDVNVDMTLTAPTAPPPTSSSRTRASSWKASRASRT